VRPRRLTPHLITPNLISVSSRYEILSDSQARAAYDQYGMEGMTRGGGGGGGFGGMDMEDVFASFFGGGPGGGGGGGGGMHFGFDFGPGGGSGGGRRRRGEDTTIPYSVTLEDLYNGKSVKMNMEKEVVCGVCNGCVCVSIVRVGKLIVSFAVGRVRKGTRSRRSAQNARARDGHSFRLRYVSI
jgi:curved DNA-binding protein CbpA